MRLWSESWDNGERIGARFAAGRLDDGGAVGFSDNVNPHLAWSDLPAGTRSLVLICHDFDVPSRGDDVNQPDREVPSDLARAQILAGVPTTSGGGRTSDRTRAVAALLAGFPVETLGSTNPLVGRASSSTIAEQREDSVTGRVDWRAGNSQSLYVRYMYSDGDIRLPQPMPPEWNVGDTPSSTQRAQTGP